MGNGLTTEEQKTIAAVFAQVPAIERAVLFGSRAMGLARSNSDVDIALYGKKLSLSDILHAASLLEDTPLPYHFDLISHASITSPELLEHIRQYGKEMYRKESNSQEKCSSERCTASDFQEYELGCVCARLSSGKGISSKDVISDGAFPVYGGNGLRGYTDKYNFDGECAIIGRQGAFCGNVRYFSGKAYMTEHAVVVCANEENDTRFLAYLLGTMNLGRLSGQSAQPGLSVKTLSKQLVLLPPLAEQKRIAQVLNSLDGKIENNKRINQHLEQMAQAIFKSWFVDFEPWGGIMPNDWREGNLSEITTVIMGQSPDGASYNEEGIGTVFYQGRAEFGFRFPTRRLFTTRPKRLAPKGAVLMSVRAPVGDINVAYESCSLGRGLAGIQSNSGFQSFILYSMFSLKRQLDVFNGQGTVFGSINKNDMANLPVLIPSDEVLCQFEKLVNPMDAAIEKNYVESCNLQETRDALLPRLMSGELSVGDAVEAS